MASCGNLEIGGKGSYIYTQGRARLLNCVGGFGVFSLGQRHPHVLRAVRKQLNRLPMSCRRLLNADVSAAAEQLISRMPGLQHVFFCCEGTMANEAAMKYACLCTGRKRFVALRNSYHGLSGFSLSITGNAEKRAPFEDMLNPHSCLIAPNDRAALATIDADTAAFFFEPIQGEAGIRPLDPDFLQAAERRCRETGTLLVADEIQTGLGRTGQWWGYQHATVQPDIVTLGKALGGGVLPVAACAYTNAVGARLKGHGLTHTSTTSGYPLGCAAVQATLEVLEQEQLVEQAAFRGAFLLERLRALATSYPTIIREVRGRGLMIGIELTTNELGYRVSEELFQRRVLTAPGLNTGTATIRIQLPLNVADQALRHLLDALEETLDVLQQQ